MAKPTIVIAALLIFVGVFGYVFGVSPNGTRSMTALIPCWIGVALAILGFLALNEKARKHAMHLAAGVGTLSFFAVGSQIFLRWAGASAPARASMIVTAILCAILVALCVRSFINARRNRAGP